MTSTPPTTPRQAWADVLLMIVFAALLWLPTVDYFGHIDWTKPLDENRMPAPRPRLTKLDLAGLRAYVAAAETCFNDHFGFRRRLVRWSQQWKEQIYRSGRGADKVIEGQKGWLYFSEGQMIEHYLGVNRFTLPQLQSWQRLLQRRHDWLAARGIKYLFVIPPDKQSVYSENLPAWLVQARPAGVQTKLDQFLEYMRAHSTVEILDLRQPLRDARQTAPTYLQNDTHWNLYGGFVGSQEIIKTLSRQLPELQPLRYEDFTWTKPPTNGGDLARMLGTWEKPEQNFMLDEPKPPLVAPRNQPLENLPRIWNQVHPTQPDCLVENTNLPGPGVDMVVFHDSYGRMLRECLGYRFHRIVFVWENQECNPRIITQYHPQVVVNELLERYLDIMDPDPILAKEVLP